MGYFGYTPLHTSDLGSDGQRVVVSLNLLQAYFHESYPVSSLTLLKCVHQGTIVDIDFL